MENYKRGGKTTVFQLFITSVQDRAEVTVQVPTFNFKQRKTLNAGESVTISLPVGIEMYGNSRSLNTVRVDASADVTVASLSYKAYTADSSVVYPTTEWGTEYFIFTPNGGSYKEFCVTNGKENNKVTVSQRASKVYVLKPYESLQIQSRSDLSGLKVASQHPVGVVTGNLCFSRFSKCDHVYEQLLPVSRWGSTFIVPPQSFQTRFDSVYLQASQATKVTVRKGNNKYALKLDIGKPIEVTFKNSEAVFIEADKGIQVLLLFNGAKRWTQVYDPFLMTILPTDNFCSSYSLEALKGFENQALIVAQTSAVAELHLDGKNLPGNIRWQTVPGTGFSWALMNYKETKGRNTRTLSSSGSRFALYNLGFSQRISYGSVGRCMQNGKMSAFKLFINRDRHCFD